MKWMAFRHQYNGITNCKSELFCFKHILFSTQIRLIKIPHFFSNHENEVEFIIEVIID